MIAGGISRVVLPIGVNAVESVNCYVLPDGDRVTVVDCGVWRPDLPDGGLAALEAGLQGAGYALADVARIVVTHAHIDHYGLAGRLMELTGAELAMHAMTDLDCEKYRHPDTARARRRDTYADHGVSEAERTDLADHLTRWLPYLHSVVEASTRLRGGEELEIGGDPWDVRAHARATRSATSACGRPARGVLLSGDHLLPGITPPVTFERGFDADPLRSYLDSLRRSPTCGPHGASRPRPPVRRRRRAGSRRSCAPSCAGWRRSAGRSASGRSVVELADRLVAKAFLAHQRQLAINETLAHIAYLRWSGRGRAADPAGRRLRVVPDRRLSLTGRPRAPAAGGGSLAGKRIEGGPP